MIDLITYCSDTEQLMTEIQQAGFERIPLVKTPTQRNGNETLALVRVEDVADIEKWSFLTILGTYEEVFADPELLTIYDRIYSRTPITVTDEEGNEYTYTPPDKFGVFA